MKQRFGSSRSGPGSSRAEIFVEGQLPEARATTSGNSTINCGTGSTALSSRAGWWTARAAAGTAVSCRTGVVDSVLGGGGPMEDDDGARPVEAWSAVLAARIAAVHEQRAALSAAIDQTREARSLMFADDEHDPDGSTASLDQARDVALLTRADQTLVELAAAEQRLAEGTYGTCERCGGPIAVERLQARPETRVCVVCASAVSRRRPG